MRSGVMQQALTSGQPSPAARAPWPPSSAASPAPWPLLRPPYPPQSLPSLGPCAQPPVCQCFQSGQLAPTSQAPDLPRQCARRHEASVEGQRNVACVLLYHACPRRLRCAQKQVLVVGSCALWCSGAGCTPWRGLGSRLRLPQRLLKLTITVAVSRHCLTRQRALPWLSCSPLRPKSPLE